MWLYTKPKIFCKWWKFGSGFWDNWRQSYVIGAWGYSRPQQQVAATTPCWKVQRRKQERQSIQPQVALHFFCWNFIWLFSDLLLLEREFLSTECFSWCSPYLILRFHGRSRERVTGKKIFLIQSFVIDDASLIQPRQQYNHTWIQCSGISWTFP